MVEVGRTSNTNLEFSRVEKNRLFDFKTGRSCDKEKLHQRTSQFF